MPLISIFVYLIFRWIFVTLAIDNGLFFPAISGQGMVVLALGLITLALRVLATVLLPGLVAYELALTVWEMVRPPRVGTPPERDRNTDETGDRTGAGG